MIKRKVKYLDEPILLKNRTFFEQQAVTDSDSNRLSILNLLLWPLKRFRFRLKSSPTIKVDYLFVGDNPVLTLISLLCLSRLNKKIDAGIFFTNEFDYWDYHSISSDSFKLFVKEHFSMGIETYNDFIIKSVDELKKSNNLNICLLNTNNKFFINYFNYDNFLKIYLFHLTEKPRSDRFEISGYTKEHNEVKEEFKKHLSRSIISCFKTRHPRWEYEHPNHPVIISKKTILTSVPQGWISFKSYSDSYLLYLQHYFLDMSVGSAQHICHAPVFSSENMLNDLKDTVSKIKNL